MTNRGNHGLDTNYFVCTLGQAALINDKHPHHFLNINEFLDKQAHAIPDAPAVGFPVPSKAGDAASQWTQKIITFGDLQRGSTIISEDLSQLFPIPSNKIKNASHHENSPRTVALLCPSSADFLFTWLGLMRKGYSVLLIAPQCQPSSIAHLCKTCGASILFYDPMYESLATGAADLSKVEDGLRGVPLSWITQHQDVYDLIELNDNHVPEFKPFREVSEYDIAYLHHTSGTSTGLPKSIPQIHRAAVGVLPCLIGSQHATFTTTPLYHGGIADCFRAWTSGAMIWLFPGKEVPITAYNILKSLECTELSTEKHQVPRVKYFSSVPYVLQMLAGEDEGLRKLEEMDIVGVGGAALPQAVGNDLVQKGVNLISRFGSAECGFLMSSHRDYATDKEWQYLRSSQGSKDLKFELQDDGLWELVILPDWPHMAKRNRSEGSFATADLFASHPSISNAWRYHSRADSQLTLITGKKFDPAPLEAAIAASPLLEDVLIFGNGQQYPGALLFRSKEALDMSESKLLEAVWPQIEKLSAKGQAHNRVSKAMLVVMPAKEAKLEKSSKGTILRGQAEKRFALQISEAYEHTDRAFYGDASHEDAQPSVADHEILPSVLDIVKSVLDDKGSIPKHVDLFSYGVDSVACMQIRGLLQKQLLPPGSSSLPLNIVYDCGTIKSLSNYLLNRRHGNTVETEDETKLMLELVKEYSYFGDVEKQVKPNGSSNGLGARPRGGHVVILTGATGALGAHLLDQFRARDDISQVLCLVRAKDPIAAQERVSKSLVQRKKSPLVVSDTKVVCVVAKLGDARLGLSDHLYDDIAERASIMVHAAWAVNFSMRLKSFVKDHIAGIRNLINLALHSNHPMPPSFLFCSSTASVLGLHATSPVPEQVSNDPSSASPLGYSRSKWVAESICSQAHKSTRLRNHMAILRIGQLCGDTKSGVWNVTEAWPLMLSSVHATNTLPELDEPLSWLPVNLAAEAVVQIAYRMPQLVDASEIPVYHLINNDRTSTWSDLLSWLRNVAAPFETVPPSQWVEQLENLKGEDAKHPARKLLGLWKSAYSTDEQSTQKDPVIFDIQETEKAAPVMKSVTPMSEEHFRLIWRWMEKEMLGQDISGKSHMNA